MFRFVLFLALLGFGTISYASCDEGERFIDVLMQFTKTASSSTKVTRSYVDGETIEGTMEFKVVLVNMYLITYSLEGFGKGTFLFAADIPDKTLSFTHMLDGGRVPSKLVLGAPSNGYCIQRFVTSGSEFQISLKKPLSIEYYTVLEGVRKKVATFYFE